MLRPTEAISSDAGKRLPALVEKLLESAGDLPKKASDLTDAAVRE
jgi:hypothetical protein